MKDIFGKKIKAGDHVAYASNYRGCGLRVGEVLGYCKNGSDSVRVRVYKSDTYGFVYGKWNRKTGEHEGAGQPYVTTIAMPDRVIIVPAQDN